MNLLQIAINERFDDRVDALLVRGEPPNVFDDAGNTLLIQAIQHGLPDTVIRTLLRAGADIYARNQQGMTALMVAYDLNQLNVVDAIEDADDRNYAADADLASSPVDLFFLLLRAIYANDDYRVGRLLELPVAINGATSQGRTPLMFAAQTGRQMPMSLLLERGADPTIADLNGTFALYLASDGGHYSCVDRLLTVGADPNQATNTGSTSLMSAALDCHDPQVTRLLLASGADIYATCMDGRSALEFAAWMGNEAIVRLLIESGAAEDKTALQRALCASYIDNGMNCAPILIEAGAEIGLLESISLNDVGIVRRMITNGKSIGSLKQEALDAALVLAATLHSETEIVTLLLQAGANVDTVDVGGQTSLLHAARNRAFDMVELLVSSGADVNARGDNGETALIQCATPEGADAVRTLLANGADVRTACNQGRSAIHLAASCGAVDQLKMLAQAAGDLTCTDDRGRTALMYAVSRSQIPTAEFLIGTGADVNATDASGISALQLAYARADDAMVTILLEAETFSMSAERETICINRCTE